MFVLFFIAKPLPIAFPPIVIDATSAVTTSVTINTSTLRALASAPDTITPAEPEMIPHISPITSLQNDATYQHSF